MNREALVWCAALAAGVLGCTSPAGQGSSSGSTGSGTTSSGSSGGSTTSTGTGSSSGSGSSSGGTSTGGTGTAPSISGCQVFPDDNPWNRDVSSDPVDPNSDQYMAYMTSGGANLHPDFGSDPSYGLPWAAVPGTQALVPVSFVSGDSDPGPYPIPPAPPIEVGSDHHILILQSGSCKLYEVDSAQAATIGGQSGWACYSGAIFDLGSNQLRPDCATSADAAGLPILPGLVRYDEVAAGAYHHAVRFTMNNTQQAFVHPATHFASSITNPNAPPMGIRLRLKSSYDISSITGGAHVVLVALQHYGMLLADNGSDFFISGETNPQWDDNNLDQLKQVPGSAFEVVQTGPISTAAQCP